LKKDAFDNLTISQKADVGSVVNDVINAFGALQYDFTHIKAFLELLNEKVDYMFPVYLEPDQTPAGPAPRAILCQTVSLTETSACSQDQKQSEQSEISEPDCRAEVGLYPNQQVSNSSKSTWDDQDVRTHYPLEAK
jgi:hypothetical protein